MLNPILAASETLCWAAFGLAVLILHFAFLYRILENLKEINEREAEREAARRARRRRPRGVHGGD